jgi:tripartite-type tricarboxylate transporter receptor subunit TctC
MLAFRPREATARFAREVVVRKLASGMHLLAVAALCAGLIAASLRCARAEEQFYRGRTLIILVGVAPGGSFDLYARLVARHLGDHIAGHPAIVVQNKSGAGGMTAANYLFNVAPRDGTVLDIMPPAIALTQALKSSELQYDARRLNWIGRLTSITQVFYTWHTSPTKTLADLQHRETLSAGTGPDADSVVFTALLNDLAGTKFKVINGYNETAAAMLALERGEVEGVIRPWEGMKAGREQDWLAKGDIHLVAQFAMQRHPELPQVGAVSELLQTEREREILRLFLSANYIGRAFALGPDVPADRVELLRSAFQAMLSDPEFRADADKLQLSLNPAPAAALAERTAQTLDAPAEAIKVAKRYYPGN